MWLFLVWFFIRAGISPIDGENCEELEKVKERENDKLPTDYKREHFF